jgi:hypothetical protein
MTRPHLLERLPAAENQLSRLTPEVMEGTYLMKLNEEVRPYGGTPS